ncbi:hypothetical protein LCGC14_0388190 [marine sediment metagenome]|uniref:Uncharacterized protein n=1 Tax=marine sediment metagenome TaxID=412755 RepID=A0A0F9TI95_9ZZZZ
MKPICPYCDREARFTSSIIVYGRDYGKIWLCVNYPKCDSYVGAHKGNGEPKGTLADKETRNYRKWAHNSIDWLWQDKVMSRKNVYYAIQNLMNLTPDEAHIGLFDSNQCRELVRVFKENLLIK